MPTTETIEDLIEEGLRQGPVPSYVRVGQLNQAIRTEVARVIPIVAARAEHLPNTQRAEISAAIAAAERTLAGGLGDGLVSAVAHVQLLARHARMLRSYEPDAM